MKLVEDRWSEITTRVSNPIPSRSSLQTRPVTRNFHLLHSCRSCNILWVTLWEKSQSARCLSVAQRIELALSIYHPLLLVLISQHLGLSGDSLLPQDPRNICTENRSTSFVIPRQQCNSIVCCSLILLGDIASWSIRKSRGIVERARCKNVCIFAYIQRAISLVPLFGGISNNPSQSKICRKEEIFIFLLNECC